MRRLRRLGFEFKLAARGMRSDNLPLGALRALADPYLIVGLALYGGITVVTLGLDRAGQTLYDCGRT